MSFNGNVWYWITETRVNYTSALFYNGNGNLYFAAADNSSNGMYWQIFQDQNGNYQFRNRNSNILQQLGVCYASDEASPSKTQPCMLSSDESPVQRWTVTAWDDGEGYKIVNSKNGTSLHMDWHPGGPGFMSPTTAEAPYQPAQHWLFTSLAIVNDGVYSTSVAITATNSASATGNGPSSASATPTGTGSGSAASATDSSGASSQKSSSHSGLSSGASAGIGVGVALAVILVAALAYFYVMRRRKRRGGNVAELGTSEAPETKPYVGSALPKYDAPTPIYEAPANEPAHELYSPPVEVTSNTPNTAKSPSTDLSQDIHT